MEVKKKILVVDDDPSVTFTISAFLNRVGPGYEMIRAFDKTKALELIESQRPQVVLLDIDLAGISAGLEVLETINKKYKGKVKPIVITGHAKDRREQIEQVGYFGFFTKPVNLKKLSDKIKDALDIDKIIEETIPKALKILPKAKLLFVEPNFHIYAYLASIFDSKEMSNGAEFTVKVTDDISGLVDVLADYKPDIVLIGDYFMKDEEMLNLVDLIQKDIKIKPVSVIVHGLFERKDTFEAYLKKQGVKHCVQNVMDNEQLIRMNRKLLDFVSHECATRNLVKE